MNEKTLKDALDHREGMRSGIVVSLSGVPDESLLVRAGRLNMQLIQGESRISLIERISLVELPDINQPMMMIADQPDTGDNWIEPPQADPGQYPHMTGEQQDPQAVDLTEYQAFFATDITDGPVYAAYRRPDGSFHQLDVVQLSYLLGFGNDPKLRHQVLVVEPLPSDLNGLGIDAQYVWNYGQALWMAAHEGEPENVIRVLADLARDQGWEFLLPAPTETPIADALTENTEIIQAPTGWGQEGHEPYPPVGR